ncbi:MAG: hypothetical protein J7K15_00900 [Deltaproteobacteria bacterium]|nr:hypothetical protein [Deltaproteobacteria bacterium]
MNSGTVGAELSLKATDTCLGAANGDTGSDQVETIKCRQKNCLSFSEPMCIIGDSDGIFRSLSQILRYVRFASHR